jgi:hypothetical protein
MCRTLHGTAFAHGKLQTFLAECYMCLVREGDAAKEEEQLARGAGHCREDWGLVLVHDCEDLTVYVVRTRCVRDTREVAGGRWEVVGSRVGLKFLLHSHKLCIQHAPNAKRAKRTIRIHRRRRSCRRRQNCIC